MEKKYTEISQLPPEQLEWLTSVKDLYKTDFYSGGAIKVKDLAIRIKKKAIDKGYSNFDSIELDNLEVFLKS